MAKPVSSDLTIKVGVPNVLMDLLNGGAVKRFLTLQVWDDHMKLTSAQKKSVIKKVAVVGLVALGICLATALAVPTFIWAVPLVLILTMGLSWSLLTVPKKSSINKWAHNWGPGTRLGSK